MVQVMLCVNNERGLSTGRVSSVDLYSEDKTQLIGVHLESGAPIFKLLNKIGDFRLGKRVFQGYNYRPCCGNVYWDYVEVSPRTAAELLNHLKRMGKWQWHVAAVAFDLIWSSPVRDFRAEDFKTDVFRA